MGVTDVNGSEREVPADAAISSPIVLLVHSGKITSTSLHSHGPN
jgi:hypothetical protein